MTPPKLKCPVCGEPMQKGKRVKLNIGWENDINDISIQRIKSTIICRECATKISRIVKVRKPRGLR